MRANEKDNQPRPFGHVHEADEPREDWQPLGVREGRKRPIMNNGEGGDRDGS